MDENGSFFKYADFQHKYPAVNTDFLTFNGIVQALVSYRNKLNISVNSNQYSKTSKVWATIGGGNKLVYNVFVKNSTPPACISKWSQSCTYQLSWNIIFRRVRKATTDTQLNWFQMRLIHRLLPTQRFLFIRKLADSPLCTFCGNEQETIVHLFWDCPFAQIFWESVFSWISENCEHCANLHLSECLVLFGWKHGCRLDRVMELIILLAKHHIYKSKLQNKLPCISIFQKTLKQRYEIERYGHSIKGMTDKFTMDWISYKNLVD